MNDVVSVFPSIFPTPEAERENKVICLSGRGHDIFKCHIGNPSALEWIIDQYRVKIDKRSGILNNLNRTDDSQYIVKLIGKVITISLETVEIINGLPTLK